MMTKIVQLGFDRHPTSSTKSLTIHQRPVDQGALLANHLKRPIANEFYSDTQLDKGF